MRWATTSVAYALRRRRYAEAARAAAGQRLSLAAPFPVEIDLTALSRRNRPNA